MTVWATCRVQGSPSTHRQTLVELRRICPAIRIELRYATKRNGIGRPVYPASGRCLLVSPVANRLARVQRRLEKWGYGLKVWDAYRPRRVQRELWKIRPDKEFVAPPEKGSKHNRGAAVDVTLVDSRGLEVPMPTDFDTFTAKARPSYQGGPAIRRRNRDMLRRAMMAEGFIPDRAEWWHFSAPDWKRYPLLDVDFTR